MAPTTGLRTTLENTYERYTKLGALQVAVRETEKYELDILATQEVRWEGQDSIRQGKRTFYYGEQSHDFGTGFLTKNNILQTVQNIELVKKNTIVGYDTYSIEQHGFNNCLCCDRGGK